MDVGAVGGIFEINNIDSITIVDRFARGFCKMDHIVV